MYARVTTFHGKPGIADEGIDLYESKAALLKDVKGFVSSQLLVDRTGNTSMVVTLYETLADLEAGTTLFRQIVADPSVVATLASPPVSNVYEVAAQVAAQR